MPADGVQIEGIHTPLRQRWLGPQFYIVQPPIIDTIHRYVDKTRTDGFVVNQFISDGGNFDWDFLSKNYNVVSLVIDVAVGGAATATNIIPPKLMADGVLYQLNVYQNAVGGQINLPPDIIVLDGLVVPPTPPVSKLSVYTFTGFSNTRVLKSFETYNINLAL